MLTKGSTRSLIADKSHIAQTFDYKMNRNIDGYIVVNATLQHWTGNQQHLSQKRANFCSVTALVTEDCETTENVTSGQVEVPLQRLHHPVLHRYSTALRTCLQCQSPQRENANYLVIPHQIHCRTQPTSADRTNDSANGRARLNKLH